MLSALLASLFSAITVVHDVPPSSVNGKEERLKPLPLLFLFYPSPRGARITGSGWRRRGLPFPLVTLATLPATLATDV